MSRDVSQIWIDGRRYEAYVYRTEITQNPGEHEVAEIVVNSESRTEDYTLLNSKRIEFRWGAGMEREAFWGYVVDVREDQRFQTDRPASRMQLTAFGPSMALKTGRPRFWTNVTVSQVVASVVAEHMLGFSNEMLRDEVVWKQLAQTTESDWEFINSLAARSGCYVICEQGVIRLIDPYLVFSRYMPDRFLTQEGIGLNTVKLYDFTPINLSPLDPGQQLPSVAYAGSGGGVSVLAAPVSELPMAYGKRTRFMAPLPVHTAAEAEAIQAAYRNETWNEQASCRVQGSVLFRPGMNVYVRSQANPTSYYTPAADGMWYINGTQHIITLDGYQTFCDLVRNPLRGHNNQTPRMFWTGDKRGKPELKVNGRGQWMSTWR